MTRLPQEEASAILKKSAEAQKREATFRLIKVRKVASLFWDFLELLSRFELETSSLPMEDFTFAVFVYLALSFGITGFLNLILFCLFLSFSVFL